MCPQGRPIGETLTTHTTMKRLGASMYTQVLFKSVRYAKFLRTQGASIRLESSMDFLMTAEVCFMVKTSPANITDIRLCSCVDIAMIFEDIGIAETFTTDITNMFTCASSRHKCPLTGWVG